MIRTFAPLAVIIIGTLSSPLHAVPGADSKPEGACCAGKPPEQTSKDSGCNAADATASLRAEWGIEVVALRLSAGGNMLDFRYKVVDSDKAGPISQADWKPHLIDHKTGAKMVVPRMPKVGALRQTAVKPVVGRVYATLFVNPGQAVKSGSKVTVVIGDCRIENLIAE